MRNQTTIPRLHLAVPVIKTILSFSDNTRDVISVTRVLTLRVCASTFLPDGSLPSLHALKLLWSTMKPWEALYDAEKSMQSACADWARMPQSGPSALGVRSVSESGQGNDTQP